MLRGSEYHVLSRVVGVVFSRCGGWYPVPYVVQWDAATSCIIGDQILFCTDVVTSVTVASLDGVVRTVTAVSIWCRPLCITQHLSVDVP